MASELHSLPQPNTASPPTLAPGDPKSVGKGLDEVGTIVNRPKPFVVVPFDPSAPSPSHDLTGATSVVESAPRASTRYTRGLGLHTRLFAIDLAASALCWVWLGYRLVQAPSMIGRLAPGVAATVTTLVAMRGVGLYRSRNCVRKVDELYRITLAVLWGAAAFAVVQSQVASPEPQLLICAGSCIVAVGACRWQFGRWLRAQRAKGRYLRGVVLVGSNGDAVCLQTMLHAEPELGYRVTGVIGEGSDDSTWEDIPSSPSLEDIPKLAASTGASGILIVPYAHSSDTTHRAISIATRSNLHVQIWPGIRGVGSRRLRSGPISGESFFYVEPQLYRHWHLAAKRAFDVIVTIVLLPFAAVLVAVSALLIKLEDGGPVFFRDERIGIDQKPFHILKLRSMTSDLELTASTLAALNERTNGPLFKASKDPRVTKVGRFLRATSLDEVPQFWNVLWGTMSLVGPRPALPHEVAEFDEDLQRRHSMRPGMTGLWQVEARHNPSFNAYRRLDLRYVDNWTLYLDLSIVLATIPLMVSHAFRAVRRPQRT